MGPNSQVQVQEGEQKKLKVLISNMPSSTSMYSDSKIKVAVTPRPFVAMATLAACCIERGIDARLIDLDVADEAPGKAMEKVLEEFKPDYVCFSFTTPLFKECCEYAKFVKEKLPSVKLIARGSTPLHLS